MNIPTDPKEQIQFWKEYEAMIRNSIAERELDEDILEL